MSPDDDPILPADDPAHAAIDALLDGDSVDKERLRAALADAGTRDYFIDALLLRNLTSEMAPQVSEAPRTPPRGLTRASRWMAAAAVIAVTAAGGYLVGSGSRRAGEDPPAPAADSELTVSVPAPAPTTVIRFERGTDWISNEGN